MGLFGKKKKKNQVREEAYRWLTVDEALALSKGESVVNEDMIIRLTDEILDQKKNTDRLRDETKQEYESILKHLSDMQRLDNLSDHEKREIMDTARTITNLENQRTAFLEGERKISGERYHAMDLYADEIPEQLRAMEERERYIMLVSNDLRQLEGERGSIKYERELAENKRKFLTKFSYFAIVAVITVFILFFVLAEYTGKNLTICFLITGALACIYAAYYMVAMKKCSMVMRKCDLMLNRAVGLINKVKIKYVNTQNALDYSYEKYKCNSHQELAYIWAQYVKEKEEEQRFKKSSQLLKSYHEMLVELLERNGFDLPDAWTHQAETLLDRRALSELRDLLESRRRKLKAQLEHTLKQHDNAVAELEGLCTKYPRYERLIRRIIEASIE
ncbi:MAG: hypothetical protein MJ131_02495 [Lachnospiraceae bacterium]|nr:hypothetical protein [Lachnospiraceae bacterium]